MGISHDLHTQYTVYREMKIRYKIPLGIVGRWSNLGRQHTSGPSPPPSEASGSRSSLMCLRERKRRCAASWLICLMLLSDSEDTSLKGGRGHVRRGGVFRASPPPAQPSLWAMHRLRPQCQATNTGSLPPSSSETIARLTLTPQKTASVYCTRVRASFRHIQPSFCIHGGWAADPFLSPKLQNSMFGP